MAGGAKEGVYRRNRRSNPSGRQGLQQVSLTMLMLESEEERERCEIVNAGDKEEMFVF